MVSFLAGIQFFSFWPKTMDYNYVVRGFSQVITPHTHIHTGIAIDSDKGRVVVVDKGNHCCWILSSTGELLRKIGGQGHGPGDLHFPFGVAIDKDGKIFISESGNNRISVFTAGGQFIKCLGKKGAEPGMFDHPRHLCFDENQKLLVADEMNQRVQIFKL